MGLGQSALDCNGKKLKKKENGRKKWPRVQEERKHEARELKEAQEELRNRSVQGVLSREKYSTCICIICQIQNTH